jgi:hypothetical protein
MSNTSRAAPVLRPTIYTAVQRGTRVTVRAQGEHPSTGYQAFFQPPIGFVPPEYVLRHIPPQRIIAPVVTPFDVQISFAAAEPVELVIVHDLDGRHDVLVDQVPLVATRIRSGGFIATHERLTVYADGTLEFVNERVDQHEMRQVHEHQLRPLQQALASRAWQSIKPVYGEPIADGFTISISGGDKHTTIADPPTTPVHIPAIVQEVVEQLEAVWPVDSVATR